MGSSTSAVPARNGNASSVKAVFDTNVLVDYLNGVPAAAQLCDRYSTRLVSVVTWMEVLIGAANETEEGVIRSFLGGFQVAELDRATAEEAVRLRRDRKIRLPDAVIWATARCRDALLVTRSTRDFPQDDPGVHVPYRL